MRRGAAGVVEVDSAGERGVIGELLRRGGCGGGREVEGEEEEERDRGGSAEEGEMGREARKHGRLESRRCGEHLRLKRSFVEARLEVSRGASERAHCAGGLEDWWENARIELRTEVLRSDE